MNMYIYIYHITIYTQRSIVGQMFFEKHHLYILFTFFDYISIYHITIYTRRSIVGEMFFDDTLARLWSRKRDKYPFL